MDVILDHAKYKRGSHNLSFRKRWTIEMSGDGELGKSVIEAGHDDDDDDDDNDDDDDDILH